MTADLKARASPAAGVVPRDRPEDPRRFIVAAFLPAYGSSNPWSEAREPAAWNASWRARSAATKSARVDAVPRNARAVDPRIEPRGILHAPRFVGPEVGHDRDGEIRVAIRRRRMVGQVVGGIVGRAHDAHVQAGEQPPDTEVVAGEQAEQRS